MTEYITNIPLEKLKPFPNHPFQVRDDDSMRETVESIKTYGVPGIALKALIVAMENSLSSKSSMEFYNMTIPKHTILAIRQTTLY